MRPKTFTISVDTADPDGIIESVTPVAGGAITMDGALVSAGVATMDSGGWPMQVGITCAGNETARTFTITGRLLKGGDLVTETIAGVNATVATSVGHYYTITGVSVDDATAGAITVGTNGVGSTGWIPLNHRSDSFDLGFAVTVGSGTVNWTVQWTYGDVQVASAVAGDLIAFTDSAFSAKTADVDGALPNRVTAMRLQINSGTDPASMLISPSGIM